MAKWIAIDTETNITDVYGDRRIIGLAIACRTAGNVDSSFYIPVGHGEFLEGFSANNVELPTDLFESLQDDVTVIFHNAKFDLHVIHRAGFNIEPLKRNMYDTMLMGHLIDENQFLALDKMGERYLGQRKEKELAKAMKSEWENIPPSVMAIYAEQDAKLTLDLYFALHLFFEKYEELWEHDRKFLFLLQEIEEKGIPVDLTFCLRQAGECQKRLSEIRFELGFDPAKPSQLHAKLFSDPPLGLGLKVTSRTPTGRPQVSDDFLEQFPHPICQLVSEYRKLSKANSSYYQAYLKHADTEHRLHATFKMQGTVTGRLSCADPNLQQIPREGNVKKAFLPEKGRQLWEIDYSQIEYRLAAVYSRDNELVARLESGESFHDIIATKLGIARQTAKTVNFLVLYGGGINKLAEFLKIPVKNAKKIMDDYREMVPALFKIKDQANNLGKANMEVRLWTGRYRHFEFPSETHKAFNAIVQGGAFEIVKRSMLKLHDAGFDIRSQVHDSVWVMVKDENEVKEAARIMSDWTKDDFGATFFVDYKRLN